MNPTTSKAAKSTFRASFKLNKTDLALLTYSLSLAAKVASNASSTLTASRSRSASDLCLMCLQSALKIFCRTAARGLCPASAQTTGVSTGVSWAFPTRGTAAALASSPARLMPSNCTLTSDGPVRLRLASMAASSLALARLPTTSRLTAAMPGAPTRDPGCRRGTSGVEVLLTRAGKATTLATGNSRPRRTLIIKLDATLA
mmetsp:Transcript_8740/g.24659  ORF Transcript_8740/g.24659 Transcript_8740/m.24659 type:complete len:201 (+) Transcript_8740:347-949(+)